MFGWLFGTKEESEEVKTRHNVGKITAKFKLEDGRVITHSVVGKIEHRKSKRGNIRKNYGHPITADEILKKALFAGLSESILFNIENDGEGGTTGYVLGKVLAVRIIKREDYFI